MPATSVSFFKKPKQFFPYYLPYAPRSPRRKRKSDFFRNFSTMIGTEQPFLTRCCNFSSKFQSTCPDQNFIDLYQRSKRFIAGIDFALALEIFIKAINCAFSQNKLTTGKIYFFFFFSWLR